VTWHRAGISKFKVDRPEVCPTGLAEVDARGQRLSAQAYSQLNRTSVRITIVPAPASSRRFGLSPRRTDPITQLHYTFI